MGLLTSIIKFYLIVLIFRTAMTRQELYFNPLGKLVGKMTDPILEKVFKLTKKNADTALPLFIIVAVALEALITLMFSGFSIQIAILYSLADILTFLMLFYIVCVIIGSFAGNSNMSHYAMFFHRLASFWVKLTRTFFPLKNNAVIIPAIIIIFAVFTLAGSGVTLGFQFFSGAINPVAAILTATKTNIFAIAGLLDIFIWLIIIRSLLTWVSPDPRNPIVQIIASLTDPILEPFRRIIPPLGAIDISPMILIFVVYFVKMMLIRLMGIIF